MTYGTTGCFTVEGRLVLIIDLGLLFRISVMPAGPNRETKGLQTSLVQKQLSSTSDSRGNICSRLATSSCPLSNLIIPSVAHQR